MRGDRAIAEDRPRAQRARTELHAALEPAESFFIRQGVHAGIEKLVVVQHVKPRTGCRQAPLDFRLREFRTKVGAVHRVRTPTVIRGLALIQMIGG